MVSTALTTWYEGYYDLWLGGKYLFRIEEMHAHYGMFLPATFIFQTISADDEHKRPNRANQSA